MTKTITLEDLHQFGQDLRKDIVDDIIKYTSTTFTTKNDFNNLKVSNKHLPTKDEFYSKMDEVIGELKDIREEQTLHAQQHSDIDDSIETIQTK